MGKQHNQRISQLQEHGINGQCAWVPDRKPMIAAIGRKRIHLNLDNRVLKDNDFITSIEVSNLNDAFDILGEISEVRSNVDLYIRESYNALIKSGTEKMFLNFYNYYHSDSEKNHVFNSI